ncbi:MAG: hypothetical protein C4545_05025 [Anaerolineaceae bacterium]|nr:MAG: hypothetical protein C4545_05025 [Anaerolineaceae bacterium]
MPDGNFFFESAFSLLVTFYLRQFGFSTSEPVEIEGLKLTRTENFHRMRQTTAVREAIADARLQKLAKLITGYCLESKKNDWVSGRRLQGWGNSRRS